MHSTEKYLDALDAALAVKDKTAITMLEPFATYLYKEIAKRAEAATGDERADWERLLLRVKEIISGIVKAGPDLW
jgi:hypothetical protein